MYKSIFFHSMFTLTLCGLTPACVASGDPDAGDELGSLEESDAAAEQQATRGLGGDADDAAPVLDEAALRGEAFPDEAMLSAGLDSGETGISLAAVTDDERWSPYRGGFGGGNFVPIKCEEGEVARGIYGRSGGLIDGLGLICAHVEADGSFGPPVTRGYAGGDGGSAFTSMCPDGHAISGFAGRSGIYLDQIRIVCDTIPGTFFMYLGPAYGAGGFSMWTDTPERGFFLTEIHGRSGAWIDGIAGRYQSIQP